MRIGIPKETFAGEKRVATTPDVAAKLIKLGYTVAIEQGAGSAADLTDEAYQAVGVEILGDAASVWSTSDIVLKVRGPAADAANDEVASLREGGALISFLWPAQNQALLEGLAARKATVLAMDSVPRISRAQKADALSSMANIAGYRAIIEAAQNFGRFFTGQVTAAGKVPPAKVFIIGAGVAGLAAIGAANGLGAIVRATDTRPEVGDQIKSLGAEFVPVEYQEEGTGVGGYAKVMSEGYLRAQAEMIAKQCKEVDVVVTTALIPGKPAPRLITAEMVASMQPGSVIVDLAAEQGGNCEFTVPGQVVERHGVRIVGYTDLPSRMARQSSQLYATNLLRLLEEMTPGKDGEMVVNMDDEMIRGATVIKEGAITWPPPPPTLSAAPKAAPKAAAAPVAPAKPPTPNTTKLRSAGVHGAPHGVRACLLRGLHGDLERHAGIAYALDERDECHQQHHRHWRDSPNLVARRLDDASGQRGIDSHHRQHGGRLLGYPAHAPHVPSFGVRP